MVDPRRLRTLFDRLSTEVSQLRTLAGRSSEEMLADRIALSAVKYGLVIAVEVCIDIGHHIISSEGLRAPEDFADVFASLADGGFISEDMLKQLQDMARFRNLLVHVYERVDDRRVIEILQTRLGDLEAFRHEVARTALKG